MSNQPWLFKPREIQRAIRSVQAVGLAVRNIEIGSDGSIRVNVGVADQPFDHQQAVEKAA